MCSDFRLKFVMERVEVSIYDYPTYFIQMTISLWLEFLSIFMNLFWGKKILFLSQMSFCTYPIYPSMLLS
jgi:hypothetical protein